MGSAEQGGSRASFNWILLILYILSDAESVISVNGADGIRDVEGKAARVAASSRGK